MRPRNRFSHRGSGSRAHVAMVKGTERVLSLRGDVAEWGTIDAVHAYWFEEELNLYEQPRSRVNFCITDNHRLVARRTGAWAIRRYDELPRVFQVRRTNRWGGTNPSTIAFFASTPMPRGGVRDRTWVFDFVQWCRFVGWFMAEGSVTLTGDGRYRIAISQRTKRAALADAVASLGLPVVWNGDNLVLTNAAMGQWLREHCGVGAASKRVPVEIKNASTEAIEAFLDGYGAGDGHRKRSGTRVFYTTSAQLADDVQEMLVKLGRAGKLVRRATAGTAAVFGARRALRRSDSYIITERARAAGSDVDKRKVRRIPYKGYVYCVSTPLQTIMVRRRGCPMWSGNSDKTTMAPRSGDLITELRRYGQQDTVTTSAYASGLLQLTGAMAVVDSIGLGAGVYDQLRAAGLRVTPFIASARAAFQVGSQLIELKDRSGEMGFLNMRAAAWWGLRERLDPTYDSQVALPADDTLLGDLTRDWRTEFRSYGERVRSRGV
jgi:LAGLIDADG-like domain